MFLKNFEGRTTSRSALRNSEGRERTIKLPFRGCFVRRYISNRTGLAGASLAARLVSDCLFDVAAELSPNGMNVDALTEKEPPSEAILQALRSPRPSPY